MEPTVLYTEILKHVKEGVYFVDTNRKITFWNNHAECISGFSASEVLSSYCYDNILNHVDDEGIHLCRQGCPLHRTIEDCFNREASVYLHHKEGYRVPVAVRTFPLYDHGELIGAIELFSNEKSPNELQRDIEELKVLAMTDQLTGLANRRHTYTFLAGKLVELEEFQTPFAVALIDIDHFKAVNDTHGHDLGDQVICTTANSLTHAVRANDLVSRWGGEEFLVVFSAAGEKEVKLISERMRMLVQNSSTQRGGANIEVTVSIGAVAVEKLSSKNTIVQLADQLMYRSKQQGRNCVTIASV